ncbi:MAG: Veg family protein [Firmicutes bacterium]|nr:Veg family protein [Bacillota bacterium]
MRTITQDIKGTIEKLNSIKGKNYIIRVNRGRNRYETYEGFVESTYPSIFTVRCVTGELNTFSYADLLSRNILFRSAERALEGAGAKEGAKEQPAHSIRHTVVTPPQKPLTPTTQKPLTPTAP